MAETALARTQRGRKRALLSRLRYHLRVHGRYALVTRRYRHVLQTVYRRRCRTFLEVGVFRGDRAVEMIQTAGLWHPPHEITYYGFDLFEDLSSEDLEHEFSKMPPSCAEVRAKLERTGANVELFKGYSRDTLPSFAARHRGDTRGIDLIFLDGGHSVETIAADWRNLQHLLRPETVVLLDDYYPEVRPELSGVGCKQLVDGLDTDRYRVEILDTEDRFRKGWGVLAIRMARVRRRAAATSAAGGDV